MNEMQRYTALKLNCEFISRQFETILSVLLGRSFSCSTRCEDDSYWSVATTKTIPSPVLKSFIWSRRSVETML